MLSTKRKSKFQEKKVGNHAIDQGNGEKLWSRLCYQQRKRASSMKKIEYTDSPTYQREPTEKPFKFCINKDFGNIFRTHSSW